MLYLCIESEVLPNGVTLYRDWQVARLTVVKSNNRPITERNGLDIDQYLISFNVDELSHIIELAVKQFKACNMKNRECYIMAVHRKPSKSLAIDVLMCIAHVLSHILLS